MDETWLRREVVALSHVRGFTLAWRLQERLHAGRIKSPVAPLAVLASSGHACETAQEDDRGAGRRVSRVRGMQLQFSKYKCPRGALQYCSLACYALMEKLAQRAFTPSRRKRSCMAFEHRMRSGDMLRKLQAFDGSLAAEELTPTTDTGTHDEVGAHPRDDDDERTGRLADARAVAPTSRS